MIVPAGLPPSLFSDAPRSDSGFISASPQPSCLCSFSSFSLLIPPNSSFFKTLPVLFAPAALRALLVLFTKSHHLGSPGGISSQRRPGFSFNPSRFFLLSWIPLAPDRSPCLALPPPARSRSPNSTDLFLILPPASLFSLLDSFKFFSVPFQPGSTRPASW